MYIRLHKTHSNFTKRTHWTKPMNMT